MYTFTLTYITIFVNVSPILLCSMTYLDITGSGFIWICLTLLFNSIIEGEPKSHEWSRFSHIWPNMPLNVHIKLNNPQTDLSLLVFYTTMYLHNHDASISLCHVQKKWKSFTSTESDQHLAKKKDQLPIYIANKGQKPFCIKTTCTLPFRMSSFTSQNV